MKRYGQYCPVAHALEAIGERWSLLIVRDLLEGPKRYTDLAVGLPGIGTNILAGRLRALEACGVVTKRKLEPPAAVTVYELTPYGRDLEEAMHALARWGARSLGPPSPDEQLTPGWSVNAIQATFVPEAARGISATYVLQIGDEAATMRVDDGTVVAERGATETADLVVETDQATLFELVARTLSVEEALAEGRVRVSGDADELERLVSMLSFESRLASARPTLV
jgi:DNA-binding HxlR family transcriptional regulator